MNCERMDKKLLAYTSAGAKSPGPAAYCVKPTIGKYATDPSIESNPAYTMQGRRPDKTSGVGPGPAHDLSNLNERGKFKVIGGQIGKRFAGLKSAVTPGPAHYLLKPMRDNLGPRMVRPGPAPSPRGQTPAPNAYNLPSMRVGLTVPIGKRFQVKPGHETPGPGHYNLPRPDLYLPGRFEAGWTMGKRFTDLSKARTPGPADYDATRRPGCCRSMKGGVCQITFGIRKPDTVPTFAIFADNNRCC